MIGLDGFRDRLTNARFGCGLPGGIVFNPNSVIHIAAAPGRLDVMGGVADYSGSLVAETTIGETARVALQRRADCLIRVASREAAESGQTPLVEVSLGEVAEGARGSDGLKRRLTADPAKRWAAYVIGCYLVLLADKYLALPLSGADIVVESDVPIGGGVSSSAALEVATMAAINAAYGAGVPDSELAVLSQRVENQIVGAPCGIMDQMSVAHGHERSLMLMLCRPHEITGYLDLPESIGVWGINSGVKHSVAGSPYTKARIGAFMGRRIVNHVLTELGQKPIAHLCELTPNRYRREFAAHMPASIAGEEFLNWLGETGDPVTRIDPAARYAVRASAEHAIYENHRVGQFIDYLRSAAKARTHTSRALPLLSAGVLMYASHWSYTRINLGSRETNLLVKMARDLGPSRGIYGAKITGGGSGGTVALLTDSGEAAKQSIDEISARYAHGTGMSPQIMDGGASPGALQFGVKVLPAS